MVNGIIENISEVSADIVELKSVYIQS